MFTTADAQAYVLRRHGWLPEDAQDFASFVMATQQDFPGTLGEHFASWVQDRFEQAYDI